MSIKTRFVRRYGRDFSSLGCEANRSFGASVGYACNKEAAAFV